jgi:redox-sensitive bicupin YhaK (pirin superfamily)
VIEWGTETVEVSIASGDTGWIQLIEGAGSAEGQALQRGDGLGFAAGAVQAFSAGPAGADLLLFELR